MTMTKKIIYTTPDGGVAVVHPTGEVPIEQLVTKVVPNGAEYEIVEEDVLPRDRTFRAAWKRDTPGHICEDLEECKVIAHERRRAKRNEEFLPHDEVIAKRIPGKSEEEAESARAEIRSRFETIQSHIDESSDVDALRVVIEEDGI